MPTGPITIFALPKEFSGRFDVIQRNALHSWSLLRPRPEIILLGDDPGTAQVSAELGFRHEPELAFSDSGMPLISDLFERGQRVASNDTVCYVNCDIVLGASFTKSVERIGMDPFLMVGRRWDVRIDEPLDFEDSAWEERLRSRARSDGRLDLPWAIDYFVFPKGMWLSLPPFRVGRTTWDNYLIDDARKRKIAVVDTTKSVLAVHQSHDFSHITDASGSQPKGADQAFNSSLHDANRGRTSDANWRMTPRLLRPAWDLTRLQRVLEVFFKKHPRLLPRRIADLARSWRARSPR
jgi:hypothetical protein